MNIDIERERLLGRAVTAAAATALALKSVTEQSYGLIYKGTREALLATGLVKPGWFPGEPGRPKTTVRLHLDDGREVSLWKRSPRRFDLIWCWTDKERAERDRQARQREAFANLRADVGRLPDSPADYRDETAHRLQILDSTTASVLCRPRGGYRFNAASRDAILEALRDVARAVATAEVTFDAAARLRELASIYDRHGAAIPQDDAFERFLQASFAPPETGELRPD